MRLMSALMVLTGLSLLAFLGSKQEGLTQFLIMAPVGVSIFIAPFSAILGAFALVAKQNGLAELLSQYYLLFRELTKPILPNDFGFTGIAVTNLAIIATCEGRFVDARELLTEKVTLKIDSALRISLLGQIYTMTGETAKALEKLDEARELYVKDTSSTPDQAHMEALGEFYSNECGLLPDVGKANEAIESGLKGLQLREKFCGADSYEVAKTLNNLGYAQFKAGKMNDARKTLQRAYDLTLQLNRSSDFAGGNITNNFGCVLVETGEIDRGVKLLASATTLPADGPFERGYREFTLAKALRAKGDIQAAAKHCAKAFRHWRSVQGLNHPDYRDCVTVYGECLSKLNRSSELGKVREAERKLSAGETVPPKEIPLIR